MTYFEIYLLTRLDEIQGTASVLAWLAVIYALIITSLSFAIEDSDSELRLKFRKNLHIKFTQIIFIISCALSIIVPTTKEAAFIYIAPAIVNNQDLQKTVKQLPELSNLGMQYLNDILKQKISGEEK